MARKRNSNIEQSIFMPIDPIYRIPDIPVDSDYLVSRAWNKYQAFEVDRTVWLERRADYYLAWDDSISPIYKGLWDGSSNLHLPITESRCMGMHARILQSIFFIQPPFYVDPQEDLDEARVKKIEAKMKYILMRYTNYNKGVFNAIDDWAWDLVTEGIGILSRGWDFVVDKYLRVKPTDYGDLDLSTLFKDDISEDEFKQAIGLYEKLPYEEEVAYRLKFNGPTLVAEDPTFILYKGMVVDSTDLDEHDTVIKVKYYSRNDLLKYKASGYMDADVVDEILEKGGDSFGSTPVSTRLSTVNDLKDRMTGVRSLNSNIGAQSVADNGGLYEFLEVYDRVDQNGGNGVANRIVYEFSTKVKHIARWTFVDRLTATGKIPLHMAHLYRRPRRSKGKGLPEILTNLNQASDILVNQSIDAGMMANNPMGAYRGGGVFDPNEFKVEPGLWLKTEDPNRDLRILSWPVNPNWSIPLQGLIDNQVGQLVSMGSESFGQIGSRVGPMRSNEGLNSLISQGGVQLDVIMKRVNQCISQVFEGLYIDCVERMPESVKISVVGMDGVPEVGDDGKPLKMEVSKSDLRARVHFGLYGNSSNMNRDQQLKASQNMAQFLLQRAFLETGVVKSKNVYEIGKDLLQSWGKMRIDRFIQAPSDVGVLTLEAEVLMLIQGMMPPVALGDADHQKKIDALQQLIEMAPDSIEKKYGTLHPEFEKIAKLTLEKHQKFLATLEQASAMQNPTGMQTSPTLGLQGGQSTDDGIGGGQNAPESINIQNSMQTEGE